MVSIARPFVMMPELQGSCSPGNGAQDPLGSYAPHAVMRTDPACPGVAANACQRVEAQHNMPAVPGIPPLPDRGPHEGNRWDAKRHRHVQRPGIVAHQNAALRKPCRELADILRDTLHDVRACPGEHAAQDAQPQEDTEASDEADA